MYETGQQFVEELHREWGLLEACDIAEEYLEISIGICKNTDPAELRFCREIKMALDVLNMI